MIKFKIDVMEALKNAGITATDCRQSKLFSQSVLTNLRRGDAQHVGADTLNRLCCILEMQPRDLIRYVEGEEDESFYRKAHKKIN